MKIINRTAAAVFASAALFCGVMTAAPVMAAPANFQFMRLGYFCLDSKDSAPGHLVFNRSVSLKDSFKK